MSSPGSGNVYRYTGDLPTAPDALGGCGRIDATGASLVDAGRLTREVFIHAPQVGTPSGLARAPNGGWYVGDVLFGRIAEFDANGAFLRHVMDSGAAGTLPTLYGNPQSIAVDAQGTLYYADLALEGSIFIPETGSDGKVWRIGFDESGDPLPPEIVRIGPRLSRTASRCCPAISKRPNGARSAAACSASTSTPTSRRSPRRTSRSS